LVKNKLAACGNVFPVSSTYWWNNEVQSEGEFVGIIKTIPQKWEQMVLQIEELHPYEVPCIMKINVEANEAYEKWIRDSVS
jgi:periplasmic divalent cation tolerance protein